ncbi:PREDICTED: trihelix transcription factor ASR3 [Camelina sativa]|uniref:Trihelix transcription factor ASR3 n=1 Tax=Camelina sativa TaxID=90675 RepID=A0ABM0TXJ0_CAMSA|nr:PREDICTED: trihelix transcription factor ASR3 [Camelina sativa]XP_010432884.1 PREDICTED: trihelix transcription factor ASR3 [Camelina sativa]
MDEGTSGSRRLRSQVAPDWTVKDCLILVNEIAAVESDCSNALSSFQKWTMISENCNALDVRRTLNQCRRKWDSLLSDYNQIKQWESRYQGSARSYWSLSVEKRKLLNLPGNVDKEIFEAASAVVMIQDDKAGTESDSDPEEDDVVDITAEFACVGSKRSRLRATVTKEIPPQKTKIQEPRRYRVQEYSQQKPTKAAHPHQNKTMEEEKKPAEEISTDEEEEEPMNIEEDVEVTKAKLSYKIDLIHAIVGRNLAKDNETGDDISIKDKLKYVRQQGDELIACLSEIVKTLGRLREV